MADVRGRPKTPQCCSASRTPVRQQRGKSCFSALGLRLTGPALFAALCTLGLACLVFAQGPDPQKLFQEASDAQRSGDTALAVRKYQECIRLRPDMIAARANLGLALLSLGRFDEAIAEDRAALAQAPDDPELRANLAMAYYQKGDLPNAAREFDSLHEKEPGNIQIATMLGTCYLRLGRATQAISVLLPLEKAHPDDLDLEWALGFALIRAGRTEEGFERAERVAEKRNSAEAYMLTAETQMKLRAFDRARRNVDEAIRLNPQLPGVYTLRGIVLDNLGDHEGAAMALEKGLEANPRDFKAHLQLGAILYSQRKLDAAQAHLVRALEIDPNSSLALYQLARVKRAQGQADASAKDLEKVVRDEPEWIEPHVELAALYYRLNRPQDGAREKQIVDRLTEEQWQRRSKVHIFSPRTPSP